ncbi:MAG: uncharacterized protein K0S65_5266, partial [Labilithrix sp.]|nr:uncharacterized protein [Labilithrix sp.]
MRGRPYPGIVFAIVALTSVAACFDDDDDDVNAGGGGADAGSGASEGGSEGSAPDLTPSLGCPAGCLPPAPAGWTGPSAVYDGDPAAKPAACPSSYSVAELEAHHGLVPTPAVCSCGTPQFENDRCKTVVTSYQDENCAGFARTSQGFSTPALACVGRSPGNQSMRVAAPVYDGTCTFGGNPSKTLPPPVFEKTQIACGLAAPVACSGRSECMTAPALEGAFTRVCIHKDGESACPSQDYAVRFVSHRGTTDNRDCTPCGTPTAKATCGNTLTIWTDNG